MKSPIEVKDTWHLKIIDFAGWYESLYDVILYSGWTQYTTNQLTTCKYYRIFFYSCLSLFLKSLVIFGSIFALLYGTITFSIFYWHTGNFDYSFREIDDIMPFFLAIIFVLEAACIIALVALAAIVGAVYYCAWKPFTHATRLATKMYLGVSTLSDRHSPTRQILRAWHDKICRPVTLR